MFQWQIDLADGLRQLQEEEDELQDETYDEFLSMLGLEHTEQLWCAFTLVWTTGVGVGQSREYSHPS